MDAKKVDDVASWPREALVAEIHTLRSRLQLAEQDAAAARKTARSADEKRPNYRDDKDALREMAAKGRIELRLPQLDNSPYSVGAKAQSDLGLTPDETRIPSSKPDHTDVMR